MRTLSPVTRSRLEAQGFVGFDDAHLLDVAPWLRLSPGLCAAWTTVGTLLASPAVLFALVPFALLGAVLPGHPFDSLYNHGIRRLLGTRPLPRYRAPRRFACSVAAVWLAGAALAFQGGFTSLGYVLGGSLALAALVPTLTDFCIPSFFWGLLFGKPGCPGRPRPIA